MVRPSILAVLCWPRRPALPPTKFDALQAVADSLPSGSVRQTTRPKKKKAQPKPRREGGTYMRGGRYTVVFWQSNHKRCAEPQSFKCDGCYAPKPPE
jgi:hypothetical protein